MTKMMLLLGVIFCIYVVAATDDFTKANNLFASTIYKEISKTEKDNFLVSPLSAEVILALTHSGCRGESAQQLGNALHLPSDTAVIESEVKTLLGKLNSQDLYTLHLANKAYLRSDFSMKNEFRRVTREVFFAESENINFSRNVKTAKVMNEWIKTRTNNKISNLISPNALNDRTCLVLINALYFKAQWSTPFHVPYTRKVPFYAPGGVVEVDGMRTKQYFNYSEQLNAKFLELPFEGDDVAMVIVLPNERDGMTSLENQLEKVFLDVHFTWENVMLTLPRFKVESEIDLKEILKKLGVTSIFERSQADLSGISGEKGDLVVTTVLQKTFIEVDESGVEAAAATYLALEDRMFVQPKEFTADRPFLFYIKVKGVIIFVGRVNEPTH